MPTETQLSEQVLSLAAKGEHDNLKVALTTSIKEGFQSQWSCDEEGRTALMLASKNGHLECVRLLLLKGATWNQMDSNSLTAGDYARDGGHTQIYKELVNAGLRCEIVLKTLLDNQTGSAMPDAKKARTDEPNEKDERDERYEENEEDEEKEKAHGSEEPSNEAHLMQKLTYSDGRLMNEKNEAVMMGWEKPLMVEHAKEICLRGRSYDDVMALEDGCGSILNVGFGLGLVDMEIQKYRPTKHTIIECHPDVYQHMLDNGWDKKPGVRILFGRWQDVVGDLELYDGIFWDTFGEDFDEQRNWHELMSNILADDGVYSYFNGLAATNQFFHDVAVALCESDLRELGFASRYVDIDMRLDSQEWSGVKMSYWCLPVYRLPICTVDHSLM